ncbi:2-succinyl-6-hydroxy-2,4-cyclohexadiene-1-carboxylate synthase [Vibrio sp. HN007]|uniref:2-succinyl-6-hydroxy-2, 4-cyclohexadiene-1-carboxylate synthase n=1 Tax=Vibrio iocasae TaxID=3098914 RepID=UPI0035D3EC88
MLATNYHAPEARHLKDRGNSDSSVLVFVHGLLGDGQDWSNIVDELSEYHRITVDLPGHGKSQGMRCDSFDDASEQIKKAVEFQLQSAGLSQQLPMVLIGYSLGARLLMYSLTQCFYANWNVVQAFIEGGNFGLKEDEAKQQRLVNDQHWTGRFNNEEIRTVLADWYQQPVFASLTKEQRENLVSTRASNKGEAVAAMLMATSLGKQPYLLNRLQNINVPLHYICGEKDKKFFELAEQSKLSYSVVEGAGHNVHKEAPKLFVKLIRDQLGETTPLS